MRPVRGERSSSRHDVVPLLRQGKSAKPLFSASPVCAYEVDLKLARVTKRCDWSEPPAPPAPVYDCKPVEQKE
ncbi:MAG: hypothetical protein M0D55_04885 [Elusimicrobiota bacterium]|nr:MAG: hypothetical protein M0D55_04885 [Elusimicrobiota bacterium]